MPDPRLLYVVTAVVVLGLVAWVVVVLSRPVAEAKPTSGSGAMKPSSTPPNSPDELARAGLPEAEGEPANRTSKPRLDSHLEIQDETDGPGGPEKT